MQQQQQKQQNQQQQQQKEKPSGHSTSGGSGDCGSEGAAASAAGPRSPTAMATGQQHHQHPQHPQHPQQHQHHQHHQQQQDQEDTFSAPTFSLRAQKKIAGQLASKKAVKIFLDAPSARVFDKMYKIVKTHTRSRPAAQKLLKQIIKINLKIGVLYLNDAFSEDEMAMADEFRDKFNDLTTALVRMQRRQAAQNVPELVRQLEDCEGLILRLIRRHLSEKSHQSVRSLSRFFTEPQLLAALFDPASPLAAQMDSLCDDVQELLDRGVI